MGVSDILIVSLFVGAGTPIFIVVQSLLYYLHKLYWRDGSEGCKYAAMQLLAVIVAIMGIFEITEALHALLLSSRSSLFRSVFSGLDA